MTTPQPPRAFCCEPMRGYSTAKCQEHRDEPALCSDVLVVHSERHGPGLPIHVDGGGGMIVIEFCPWCGTRIGDGAGTATPAEEEWDQSFKTLLAYSRLLRGMARRTAILRGKLLDETLPDRGVVTAVAVARTPREPEGQDDRLRTEIMLARRAAEKTADVEGNLPLSWVRTILERIELMATSAPPAGEPASSELVCSDDLLGTLGLWGQDRRDSIDRRAIVRAAWPELGVRLDDLADQALSAFRPGEAS